MRSMSVLSCRFASCVHHVAVLNTAFYMTCSLLILAENARGDQSRSHDCLLGMSAMSAFIIFSGSCTCTEML